MNLIDEKIESFAKSGNTFRSQDIADKINEIRESLLLKIEASLSDDVDGREASYRELNSLRTVMNKLFYD